MPYIKLSQSSGTFQMLPAMKTMVAGVAGMMDGIPMELAETHMHHGDIVVLYTGGMTEAINEEFGEERLEELLNKYSDLSAKDMCNSLIQDVQVSYQAI